MGKLTDAICRSLNRLDKKYYKPGNYPGVQFWVLTSGTKTWYYQYRTPNKKYPVSKRLGNYPHVGLVEAHKKAKQLAQNIFNGIYPEEQEKSDKKTSFTKKEQKESKDNIQRRGEKRG